MINISASLIRDFLDCPQKAYFRLYYPELSEVTPEQKAGSLVHKVVETCTKREDALDLAHSMIIEQDLIGNEAHIKECINNYFDTFFDWTDKNDIVEAKFKLDYKGFNLVGKIDRIIKGSTLIDWKTSIKPPKDLDKDVQFIIYQEAFEKLYGFSPVSMIYASLGANKAFQVHTKSKYREFVFNNLIPKIVYILSSPAEQLFYKRGILQPNFMCNYCGFARDCLSEEFESDVVDS